MTKVWETSPQRGAALLCLLALADFANDEGICFPLVPTLAHKIRLEERATQKWVSRLHSQGEIYRAQARGRKHSNRFLLIAYIPRAAAIALLQSHFGMTKQQAQHEMKKVRDHAPQVGVHAGTVGVHARAVGVHAGAQGVHARAPITTSSNRQHRTVSNNHHPGGDGLQPLSQFQIDAIRELGVLQGNIPLLEVLPHVTESYIMAWSQYRRENPGLRGGFFFTQMRDAQLPPSHDTARFAAQWQREQAEREGRR